MRWLPAQQNSLLMTSLVLLGLFLALAFQYPILPSLSDPRAGWITQVGLNLPRVLIHLALYAGLTVCYIVSIRISLGNVQQNSMGDSGSLRNNRGLFAVIVAGWLAYSLTLLTISPVGESHDIFDYMFRGRMMVEYNANPLVIIPKNFDNAPYYLYIGWYDHVDTYGPLWEMTSAGIAWIVHQTAQLLGWWSQVSPTCPDSIGSCQVLILYLTGYRLVAVGLTGICAIFIFFLLRIAHPDLVPAALVAWLWNPMTLFSSAVGGHNDLLMLVFFLLSLRFIQLNRFYLAILGLILAAHVKLTALIWAPVFVFWIVRVRGFRGAFSPTFAGLLTGLGISWLLYLPFGGWVSLPRMLHERSLYYANSIWKVVYKFFSGQPGWMDWVITHLTNTLPNWLFLAGALCIPVLIFGLFSRRKDFITQQGLHDNRLLWLAATLVSLFYLAVGAFWFQHWYILWVIASAVLLPFSPLTGKVLPWFVFGALSANFLEGFLVKYLYDGEFHNYIYVILVALIWLPGWIAYFGLNPSQRKYIIK